MATFRFRSNRWQARVRRQGHPDETRSFLTHKEAERWARTVESGIDHGSFISPTQAKKTTLGDLIQRYIAEVLPSMKGATDDTIRLKAICRRPICRNSIASLSPAKIAEYRDIRLREVAPGTVVRELAYLSSIINHGRREWGIHANNPVALVRKPTQPKGRERVLSLAERERLLAELQPTGRRNTWMPSVVILALETAMRRSELLALRWGDINLDRRTATLQMTKNGESRIVPLSTTAIQTLTSMPQSVCGAVFPITSCALAANFDNAVERAKLPDLHFHDLRHTAITNMANKLPNLIELAAVSGHKSLKMLQRYYHPDVEDLARKLG
ncbi:site-specific tyrosine recombinase XerC [Betaproteobacteria bacterium MOLA814]|nr:site-specific tyrosine recombinase XerC [Betaproteobacteria bacterium MOLA814]